MDKKKTDTPAGNQRYLTFYIENEQYGLNIQNVREIIASMNITNVPKTPSYIKGVINLRGVVIPIVDVRLKFGLEEKPHDVNTAIIINVIDNLSIGFIVDRVEDVLTISKDRLTEAPKFGTHVDTSFIENVAEVGDGVIMILNLKRIFEEDELAGISTIESKEE
ncbi:MAG: chemotaxis protein CheW [Sulfurospirillaceae bacterium]|jgi:purine-binding chemotaxis protein CheW|nr:chemotaxis protein CheW [Sulfurospirillaceae bacterium]MCK9545722.1 chemotaxis protein CheW [Sulfurospirillaceae bacterium]MDY0237801.1 chemotaxis protein CheW [Campylobacterales bacterium]NLM99551.1 purine-binding chemotaxis protein CheW [Campylobacteraceae bacterium]